MQRSPITLCGSLSLHPASLGAAIHRAGYEALGLAYAYVPFAVEDLAGALTGMRALGIRGFGVSMPYKLAVMPLLDRLDPLAARIGAVNTVVNDDGVLTGHNTDAYGAARALEEAAALPGLRVLLLGAGGAARAVGHALKDAGAVLTVVNRTPARGAALARALDVPAGDPSALHDTTPYDAVVNCTAAGMADQADQCPLPDAALRPGLVVMDIVYKPVRTVLLARAQARGARTVHGGRMLLHQAFRQFELYTGRPAPAQPMEAALRAHLGE